MRALICNIQFAYDNRSPWIMSRNQVIVNCLPFYSSFQLSVINPKPIFSVLIRLLGQCEIAVEPKQK